MVIMTIIMHRTGGKRVRDMTVEGGTRREKARQGRLRWVRTERNWGGGGDCGGVSVWHNVNWGEQKPGTPLCSTSHRPWGTNITIDTTGIGSAAYCCPLLLTVAVVDQVGASTSY